MLLAHLDCKVNALGWMRIKMNDNKKKLGNVDAIGKKSGSIQVSTKIPMGFSAFCSQYFMCTLIQQNLGLRQECLHFK